MDQKTKELVETAEQLAEKATPGPWFDSRYHDDQFGPHVEDDNGHPVALCDLGVAEHDHNGRFIEHARAAVPALCSAVREQDKRARHAEEERDAFSERIDELEKNRQAVIDGMARAITAEGYANKACYAAQAERDELRTRVTELEAQDFKTGELLAQSHAALVSAHARVSELETQIRIRDAIIESGNKLMREAMKLPPGSEARQLATAFGLIQCKGVKFTESTSVSYYDPNIISDPPSPE